MKESSVPRGPHLIMRLIVRQAIHCSPAEVQLLIFGGQLLPQQFGLLLEVLQLRICPVLQVEQLCELLAEVRQLPPQLDELGAICGVLALVSLPPIGCLQKHNKRGPDDLA